MRSLVLLATVSGLAALAACSSTTTGDSASNVSGGPSASATATSSTDPGTGTPPVKKDAGTPLPPDPGTFDAGLVTSCTPAPGANEVYQYSAMNLAGDMNVSMCSFEKKVTLYVNVASHCGNTPQYAPLQALWETYRDQGLVILGFPCNQFGAQESGTAQEISTFCTQQYHITFPMFAKLEVNGAGADPIYKWLKAQPLPAGDPTGDIEWNFAKFLVGRDGKVIHRYAAGSNPGVEPFASKIKADIEAALAK